jgi:hypothetical protein
MSNTTITCLNKMLFSGCCNILYVYHHHHHMDTEETSDRKKNFANKSSINHCKHCEALSPTLNIVYRDEGGCMKRKIVWGKVKHSCYFSAKTSLKFVSTKNKVRVSFCPVFHTAPFSPKLMYLYVC